MVDDVEVVEIVMVDVMEVVVAVVVMGEVELIDEHVHFVTYHRLNLNHRS